MALLSNSAGPLEAPLLPGVHGVGTRAQHRLTRWLAVAPVLLLVASLFLLLWAPTTRAAERVPHPERAVVLEAANVDGVPRVALPGISAPPPPLYRVRAKGLREAGRQHGSLARERIKAWFASGQLAPYFDYVHRNPQAFEEMKHRNAKVFPEYVEEMEGIAEGAGVTLDEVWCANFMNEITNLLAMEMVSKQEYGPPQSQRQREMACSDLFAIAPGGYQEGFACGHNEDWSAEAKHFYYYIAYTFDGHETNQGDGTPFTSCAGMTYPAHIIGSPATFNIHGLYASQNHLTPTTSQSHGLALAFIKRRALCESRTYEDFVGALTEPGWSSGASMNFMDLKARRMAQIETWEDRSDVLEITEAMGNYSHFNEYRRLRHADGDRLDDFRSFISDPRQPRTDSLPPPRSAADVARGLSDYQVFSGAGTITTVVVNGSAWTVHVWCCGNPAESSSPLYAWDIRDFF